MSWRSYASINKHSQHFLNNWNIPVNLQDSHCKTSAKKPTFDPNELKNYGPVSYLSFFSKLFEEVVLAQVFSHLNSRNLISEYRWAYHPGHSTQTALLKVANDLLTAMDTGQVSVLTLLDLSAAFDTIDHMIYYFTVWNTLSASKERLLHGSGHIFQTEYRQCL